MVEFTSRLYACGEFGITGHTRNEVIVVLRLDVNAVGYKSVEFTIVVNLVRLYDKAVVIARPFGVVARIGINAYGLEARCIVVGSKWIVVGCRRVGTSCDFKFVADAVAIIVVEAVALAVVTGFSIIARSVVIGSRCLIVARSSICTSCDFELVAYAVTVGVIQASAIAVVAGFRSVSFAIACTLCDALTSAYATFIKLLTRSVVIGS